MLVFSSKSKLILTEFISPMSPTQNCCCSYAHNPKNLPLPDTFCNHNKGNFSGNTLGWTSNI